MLLTPLPQMTTEHDLNSVDGSGGGDTKRKSRNQSEKRRRDAFNKLISELTGIVGDGEKKMDKSNVLKQAIMYLRSQRAAVESTTPEGASTDECSLKFAGTTPKEIGRLYLEALEAGAFVLCYTGNVQFASSNFAAIFGFDAKEMKGKCIFDLMTADSATELQQAMSAQLLRAATSSQGGISDEAERVHKFTVQTKADGADRPSRKALLVGRFRRVECSPMDLAAMAPTGVALNPTNDVLCLVGVGRPLARRGERHLFAEDCRSGQARQFILVFNTDWTCIEADIAATHVTGYTHTELLGTSGFDYCHVDDLENVVVEHRQLIVNGVWHSRPERFLTKAGQWVWLRCDATMERDVATNEPRRVRCVYSVASRESLLRPPNDLSTVGLLSTIRTIDRTDEKDLKRRLQPAAYIEQYPIPAKRPSLTPTNSLSIDLAATSVFSSPLHRRVWEQLQQTAHVLQQQISEKQNELQQLLKQQSSTVNSIVSPPAAPNDVYSPQSGNSS